MTDHYEEAQRLLNETPTPTDADPMECYAAAGVHATLALADAVWDGDDTEVLRRAEAAEKDRDNYSGLLQQKCDQCVELDRLLKRVADLSARWPDSLVSQIHEIAVSYRTEAAGGVAEVDADELARLIGEHTGCAAPDEVADELLSRYHVTRREVGDE